MVSVQVSTDRHAPAEIFGDIENDIIESADRGLFDAASLVPGMLRANFLEKGTRGGLPMWRDISIQSLDLRTSNFDPTQPLIDTGNLMSSGKLARPDEGVIEVTLLEYGFQHDEGTAISPLSGMPVPQRPHMYLVEGMDTDLLDHSFERGFNSE